MGPAKPTDPTKQVQWEAHDDNICWILGFIEPPIVLFLCPYKTA